MCITYGGSRLMWQFVHKFSYCQAGQYWLTVAQLTFSFQSNPNATSFKLQQGWQGTGVSQVLCQMDVWPSMFYVLCQMFDSGKHLFWPHFQSITLHCGLKSKVPGSNIQMWRKHGRQYDPFSLFNFPLSMSYVMDTFSWIYRKTVISMMMKKNL